MPICEARVRCPHDLLQLEELGEEARELIIDFGSIFWDCSEEKKLIQRN
jgi:hypothetical protein